MAGTTFQELLDGVALYYGSGSDQWAEIARYGVNQQTIPIIQQVPGVTVTMSNSGKYLGYDYNSPFATPVNPASAIDSNLQTGAYGDGSFNAQIPASAVTDQSTGTVTLQSGAVSSSTGSVVATIADRASLAVAGVALGTKLGKLIDSGLYAINPEWWDEHYPTINPQTWDDIATTQCGKNFIRSLFGLQNDDATMYLDERMLAYTYMMLLANGAYGSSDETEVPDDNIFNLPGLRWLNSSATAMLSIVIISVWKGIGAKALLILGSLKAIPESINEAAALDNAKPLKKFFKITLPMISPQLFYLVITSVMASFKVFESVRVLTQGGPGNSTDVLVFYIYRYAFESMKLGYASAAGVVLSIILMIFSIFYFRMLSKRVHYQ